MTNKEKYKIYCNSCDSIPIFSQYWWLDALAGPDNWDVVLIEKDNKIIASWPYFMKKVSLFKYIQMPILTQNMGIHIQYPVGQKRASIWSYEKDIIFQLIEKLPKFDWFRQSFHYSFINWLPLYWKGFKQTTAYTFVLEDVSDLDKVYANFNQKTRNVIRKAEKYLSIEKTENIELIYILIQKTYDRQKQKIPYSLQTIRKLYNALKIKGKVILLIAKDANKNIHSAHLYVWDEKNMYYLLGGSDTKLRNSGSSSLLMWEGIKLSSKMGLSFDFEGSMIQPIARFFNTFGGEMKPYFKIEKINSRVIKFKRAFK